MNPQPNKPTHTARQFKQAMVDERPRYDNKIVQSRTLPIIRKDLRTGRKPRWI